MSYGQISNEKAVDITVKENTLIQVEINSLYKPVIQTQTNLPFDSLEFDAIPSQPNVYTLNYKPASNVLGETQLILEYYRNGSAQGSSIPDYTTINFRIKPSLVETVNDFYVSDGGLATIFPLENDSSTDGQLELVKIGLTQGVIANITSTTGISYEMTDAEGYIIYYTEDEIGTRESGIIHLVEENTSNDVTHAVNTDNQGSVDLVLPGVGYSAVLNPTNGQLLPKVANQVFTYKPYNNYTGSDIISFVHADGGSVTYNITVLNNATNNSFVVDDNVFVPTNGSKVFNVLDNDLKTGITVFNHSSELTDLGNGSFEYTAAQDFHGDIVLFYQVFSNYQLQTAEIKISVDDFEPVNDQDYAFDIIESQVLNIQHNSPIEDYNFTLSVPAAHGTVSILSNNTISLPCEVLSGNNNIIYEPNAGYIGLDEFEVEYCTTTGHCSIVKIDVNIINQQTSDCLCLDSCVYPGDLNDDGIVNALDLLVLGNNMGQAGYSRSSDYNGIWTGQTSSDWNYMQRNNTIDLKCGDATGDGYIDNEDIALVNANYGRLSQMAAELNAATTDLPIIFIPRQSDIDSGELLLIDIAIGNVPNPSIDMSGVSFSFFMNPELIDSASVAFNLNEDAWINYNSPTSTLTVVPEDGQIDIAFSRLNGTGADGLGIVGVLEFIVEDEICGLQRTRNEYHSLIEMRDIVSVDSYGQYYSHPDDSHVVISFVDDESDELDELFKTSIFPNPSQDVIKIVVNNYLINTVDILDPSGRVIRQIELPWLRETTINLDGLEQGVYMISINDTVTKKVIKL